jgi:hypothetical protein
MGQNGPVVLRPLSFSDLDKIIALKGEVIKRADWDPAVEKIILEWLLSGNTAQRNDYPVGFVLEHDHNIVGSVVLVPARFLLRGEEVYGCFEIDLMVSEKFRFHGLKLMREVWQSDLFPVVFGTTPNKVSFSIEKALGATPVPATGNRYILITDPAEYAGRSYSSKIAARLIAMIGDMFFVAGKLTAPRKREEFEVVEIKVFGEEFDVFFKSISGDYACIGYKDSRWLNWRYNEFPFGRRVSYKIVGPEGKLRGYIVIQYEKISRGATVANILELVTAAQDINALRALIEKAVQYSKKNHLGAVSIIPPGKHIEKTLNRMGFIKRPFPIPSALYRVSGAFRDSMSDNGECYLSAGDGDTSTFAAVLWDIAGHDRAAR